MDLRLAWIAAFALAATGCNQSSGPTISSRLEIEQNIGDSIPRDAAFRDETGTPVTLGSYLGKRPLMIVPVELGYEGSSALVNDSLMKVLGKAGRRDQMRIGRDLDVLILGIKPDEKPELGLAEKRVFVEAIDAPTYFNPLRGLEPKRASSQPDIERGLHFLTGDLESILSATNALGFKFLYDPNDGIMANSLGTAFVSKDGVITGYTIGREVVTKFAELNLADATSGRLSEKAESSQKHAVIKPGKEAVARRPIILAILTITGVSTFFVLAGSIAYMSIKYRTPAIPSSGSNETKPGGPQA